MEFYRRKRGGEPATIDQLVMEKKIRPEITVHGLAVWVRRNDRPGRELRRIEHDQKTDTYDIISDKEFRERQRARPRRNRRFTDRQAGSFTHGGIF